jgi:glycosyltransferase involved in cell wall biosynthesis
LTVYDLIPVVAPQFLNPSVDVAPHFARVLRDADRILVISASTRDDLTAYAADAGVPMPETRMLPLGSDLVGEAAARPPQLEQDELPDGYVLTVGTVEIRKNHHLLLDVWERLVQVLGKAHTPRLVVAGQRGWLSAETVARLTRTPSLRAVVSFVEGPTDGELAWLYRNCAFSVYPALYEGWGLPVSESLDFGKLCITSNRSSLPEAGEGLTDLLDPFDRTEWTNRIMHHWNDRGSLSLREEAIRRSHRHVASEDTARAVIEATTFDALADASTSLTD